MIPATTSRMENSVQAQSEDECVDAVEPLQKVQALTITDTDEIVQQQPELLELDLPNLVQVAEDNPKSHGHSKPSNSKTRNRCYRRESNSFSEEETVNDDINNDPVGDAPGPSRPRSRSVEGKRPAKADSQNQGIPLAKYRRQHDSDHDEDVAHAQSSDSEPRFTTLRNRRSGSANVQDTTASTEHEEGDESSLNHTTDDGDVEIDIDNESSSSDDHDEDSRDMLFEETSSSSEEESLPDGDENGGNGEENTAGNSSVDNKKKNDSKADKKVPDSLPSPLCKPKPKETWNPPRALVQREVGYGRGRNAGRKQAQAEQYFRAEFYGSLFSAERLELMAKLEGHQGCVNCLGFNHSGTRLVSGSDDLDIKIWNYTLGKCLTSFRSGHRANVFQAKFIPFLGTDTMIVSSGRDNQVRLNELSSSGEVRSSRKLAQHRGPCHKLSISVDNPNVILSCGEDAVVFSIDTREDKPNRILNVRENGKKVALYSLSLNPLQPHEFCVSGKDSYVRIFDIRKLVSESAPRTSSRDADSEFRADLRRTAFQPVKKFCPHHLMSRANSSDPFSKTNVTSAVYNYNGNEILASYNNEHIYLFDSSHSDGADFIKKYEGHRNSMTVKGVNFFGDKSQFIISGSDCGNIFIWEKNTESIVNFFRGDDKGVVNCLEGHPTAPILATSGLDDDIKIWVPGQEFPPKMSDLLTTVKRNKRKRENAGNSQTVSDGFIMWALRHQMRAVRRVRAERRQEDDDDSDSMEDLDWEDDDDDDEDGAGGMDCVLA